MPRVLVLDNYDSFTYNLVQYLGELGAEVEVHRNDAITVKEIEKKKPDRIVISPGPCTPKEAGISEELVLALGPSIPILGVCLGHQAIGEAYGGEVVIADRIMHGKTSLIIHDGQEIFHGIDNPFEATRYHSLVVKPSTLPMCLRMTAWTADKEIMGLRHAEHPVWGVQFHPESILTKPGKRLIANFLEM
jgi:anthranilate synthase/aminodeoxychorismate synthase-like glutamine amidotransferase